jgi:hypothetical protein
MSLFFRTGSRQPTHTGLRAQTPFPFGLPCATLPHRLAGTRLCRSCSVVIGPPLHHSATRQIRWAPFSHGLCAGHPHLDPPPLISKGVARPPPSPFYSYALPYANSCANNHPPPPLTSCPPPETRASPTSMDFELPPPLFPLSGEPRLQVFYDRVDVPLTIPFPPQCCKTRCQPSRCQHRADIAASMSTYR